jgi:hypothetical protein
MVLWAALLFCDSVLSFTRLLWLRFVVLVAGWVGVFVFLCFFFLVFFFRSFFWFLFFGFCFFHAVCALSFHTYFFLSCLLVCLVYFLQYHINIGYKYSLIDINLAWVSFSVILP